MSIILVGLAVLLFGFITTRIDSPVKEFSKTISITGAIIVAGGIFIASLVQVEPGEVGVQKLFGKVDNNTLESGLNMINPLKEVVMFDIKTQNYTMSAVTDEGSKLGDDAIRVLSADGLEVIIDLTVLFRVLPSEAPNILKNIGSDYVNTIVRPICRTKIRDNAVYYEAVSLYSLKRDEFQAKIFNAIETNFKERGLILEQLLVRNITLPESVKASIESKINAEQDAQKMTFVLQKEKQEAERKRVEAQGIADYQTILSTGLSDKQLQYEMIKAIATSPNAKLIILDTKKNVPFIIDGK
ncbi:MAG: prohibitin family protein [Bacteroidales bacterium]|nr:prohibitin family protein [Bacteroidales bacterium]